MAQRKFVKCPHCHREDVPVYYCGHDFRRNPPLTMRPHYDRADIVGGNVCKGSGEEIQQEEKMPMKPWTHELLTIYDASGIMICRCSTIEQAAFIVKACNAYDGLIDDLKDALDGVETGIDRRDLAKFLKEAIYRAEAKS